jgi:CxxC motif-containing protein (DUF1111 family)
MKIRAFLENFGAIRAGPSFSRTSGLLLLGMTWMPPGAAIECGEERSGGEVTVFDSSRSAFSFPAPNLSSAHRTQFFVGNSFFNQNWVAAPATSTARDGLGPLYVARSCSTCHFKDGRGAPPSAGSAIETMVVRLARITPGEHNRPQGDPVYGTQLQTRALPQARPEARVVAHDQFVEGTFSDGEKFTLRRPIFLVTDEGYGSLSTNIVAISALVSPAMIGLGLLEAVPEKTLRQIAERQTAENKGISGRLNWVWDLTQQCHVPGRFGWKAEQPSVAQQTAAAFNSDMGLTTTLLPDPNHTEPQKDLGRFPDGGQPEVSDQIFEAVVNYLRTLAVPARRGSTNSLARRGQKLFHEMNCAACHTPNLQTGAVSDLPELSEQAIYPYTDMLLHDMGEGLADGRRAFEADGSEWRTAPLWGIGLVKTVNGHTFFLHDGRARNLAEAILWHGGEAADSKEQFRNLNREDREAVIAFLESL